MIKRITAIIMTIIICCGVFVMPVYAVDYSTMDSGFENIDLDSLTEEEQQQLMENEAFMEWYNNEWADAQPLLESSDVINETLQCEMKGMYVVYDTDTSYRYTYPTLDDVKYTNAMIIKNNTKYILIYYETGGITSISNAQIRGTFLLRDFTTLDEVNEIFINSTSDKLFAKVSKSYLGSLANWKIVASNHYGQIYSSQETPLTIAEYLKEYSGNTGGDSGNTGGDSGNTGGDSSNTGGGSFDDTDKNTLWDWLKGIWEGIKSIPEKIGEVGDYLLTMTRDIVKSIGDGIGDVIETIGNGISSITELLEGMTLRGVLDSLGIMSNGEFLMTIGNNIAEKMDGNQFYTSLIYIKNELVEIFGADYNSYRGFVNTHPFRLTLRRTVNPNGFGETSSDSFEHFGYNKTDYGVNNMSIIGDMKWFFGTSANNNNTVVNTYNWANADGSPAVKHYSDLIIGAFMWVAFAYYLWLRLPDLISGDLISITHSAGNEIRDAKPTEYKTLTYDNDTGEVLRNTTTRKEKKR